MALHQACLVTKKGSISAGAASGEAGRPIGSEFRRERTKVWNEVFTHLRQLWQDELFEHYLLCSRGWQEVD